MQYKMVADDQIPFLEKWEDPRIVVVRKSGRLLSSADLMDADILLVRSITLVNAQLLQGTSVRYVGTTAAGVDHIDTEWLESHGIAWGCAAGANAKAVAEYVLCCIAALRTQGILLDPLQQLSVSGAMPLRAAVIGVGKIGVYVAQYLTQLGFEVFMHDPVRAAREEGFISTALTELTQLDFIAVHAALTKIPPSPTYHLLGEEFLQQQKSGCVLLNAARGGVIDTQALLRANHLHLCMDVWEGEPQICLELLRKVKIASPHIAGYSWQAKWRATQMLFEQMWHLWGQDVWLKCMKDEAVSPAPPVIQSVNRDSKWESAALAAYQPFVHTHTMKSTLLSHSQQVGHYFEYLRRHYPLRQEFLAHDP